MSNWITVSEYPDVRSLADTLGCHLPSTIALLPRNFDSAERYDELRYEGESSNIRKAWKNAGVESERIEPTEQTLPEVHEKSFVEWVGPVLFIAFSFASQHEVLTTIALNVISDYVTGFFKGSPDPGTAKLTIVAEQADKSYKRIDYHGPVDGLKDLPKIINSIGHDDQ